MIANPDLSCPFRPPKANGTRFFVWDESWMVTTNHIFTVGFWPFGCFWNCASQLLTIALMDETNGPWQNPQRHGLSVYHPLFLEFHTSFLGMMHTKSVFISSIDSQDHQISITHDGSMGLVNSPHIFSLICMVNGKCK